MTHKNANKLVFPTDRYGFTSKFKQELIKAASNVRGDADKYTLFLDTVQVIVEHCKLKYADECKNKDVITVPPKMVLDQPKIDKAIVEANKQLVQVQEENAKLAGKIQSQDKTIAELQKLVFDLQCKDEPYTANTPVQAVQVNSTGNTSTKNNKKI